MDHFADADPVSAHYTAGDLDTAILAHLRAAGVEPDALQNGRRSVTVCFTNEGGR